MWQAWTLACFALCLGTVDLARGDPLKVHIVFSQHLDVGYNSRTPGVIATDDAAINVYFDRHFPNAIATANAFRQQNGTRAYKWMAHAWLISLYFDCPIGMGLHCPSLDAKEAVDKAIRRGDIFWHALPFNGQAEFFDAALFEYSAFFVHQIDDQFNLTHKRVASLRDVPGITRAALPLLNRQGVVALSQGVNGASAPPGIPKNTPAFWRDPASGAQVLHWVHAGGYSGYPQDSPQECVKVPDFNHVLCHAWKLDNEGPHSFDEATKAYQVYEEGFPGAEIFASTFDDYVRELETALPRLKLPTYSGEIGDTWVYGIPSDSLKVSRYMAALRLRASMTWRYDDYAYFNFSRLLMKIPEHTWGVDIRWTIGDYINWRNDKFHALLDAKAPNFLNAVLSWKRQAKYVDWALEALGLNPDALEPHLAVHPPAKPEAANFVEAVLEEQYETGNWKFALDPKTGGLSKLQRIWSSNDIGADWASPGHPVGQLTYDTYVESDFNIIFDHYTYAANAREWANYDFGKANCTQANPRHEASEARIVKTWARKESDAIDILVHSELPEWTWRDAGAPREVWTRVRSSANDDSLYLDVTLKLKTATRLPEAIWVHFSPDTSIADPSSWQIFKLGQPFSPMEVMLNGSQSQHAVSPEGISVASHARSDEAREILKISSLDAALVSPGKATAFPIGFAKPDMEHGVSYGLVNNIWGTNYPQWQPYDAAGVNLSFRFVINTSKSAKPHAAGAALSEQGSIHKRSSPSSFFTS